MEQMRTHRVGTITAGLSMIAFGVLFLLHILFQNVSYELIFRLWPVILIGLGLELLASARGKDTFVYDKAAIFLLILLTFFAMGMAGADLVFRYCAEHVFL